MSDQEKKDKKVGLAVSVGLHVLMLLLFFFILAWRAPDPPLPDYGIELNFGTDEAGSGDKQPTSPANESTVERVESRQPESQPEPVREVVREPAVQPQPVVKEPTETVEEVVSQPQPSPVTKQEVKKVETKPEPVKEPVKEQPKKETAKPALFPTESKSGETANANQGDRQGAVGDQGNPEGSLDSRALYGEQGGGKDGAQLNISGWRWDEAPNKRDQSAENGRIVFRFKIDDQGYVIDVSTVETTVSPKVTQFYREQLQRTTFSPTSDNAIPAPSTTGTVTFIIKAR